MSVATSHSLVGELPPRVEGAAACRSDLVRPVRSTSASAGFTLVEVVIVVALIGVMVALVATRLGTWRDREAVRSAARNVEGAFYFARSEAVRKGNIQIVFFRTDMAGNPLVDAAGDEVPILVLDDGRPGSANQNCQIDVGEEFQTFKLERGVSFGPTAATMKVVVDEGTQPFAGGFTFENGAGGGANWVLFRPDGIPRAVTSACVMANLGTGGGGIYVSNAERDAAIVLSPLGASRVFAWNGSTTQWY